MQAITHAYGFRRVLLPMPARPMVGLLQLFEHQRLVRLPVTSSNVQGLIQGGRRRFSSDFAHFGYPCRAPRYSGGPGCPFLREESTVTKRFIVVAGNIGAGKTSITERIGALGWAGRPRLSRWPIIRTCPTSTPICASGHSISRSSSSVIAAQQHLALANSGASAIADRSIYEDAHIFARARSHG